MLADACPCKEAHVTDSSCHGNQNNVWSQEMKVRSQKPDFSSSVGSALHFYWNSSFVAFGSSRQWTRMSLSQKQMFVHPHVKLLWSWLRKDSKKLLQIGPGVSTTLSGPATSLYCLFDISSHYDLVSSSLIMPRMLNSSLSLCQLQSPSHTQAQVCTHTHIGKVSQIQIQTRRALGDPLDIFP